MAFLEARGCGCFLGLATNKRLKTVGPPWCGDAALCRVLSRRLFQTPCQAGSWIVERRVIARDEATAKGSDARFIVTNRPGRARRLYDKLYCARGVALQF